MKDKVVINDIFDINKKTGELIFEKNRLDDYVAKFLNKYCKHTLEQSIKNKVYKNIYTYECKSIGLCGGYKKLIIYHKILDKSC